MKLLDGASVKHMTYENDLRRFGMCEGIHRVIIKKDKARLTIFNVYREFDREGVLVDEEKFFKALFQEVKISFDADGEDPHKLTVVMGGF